MNKNGIIAGSVSVVVIAIIAAYGFSQFDSETLNLDMGQTHGTISTAIGSPILGDPDAPITIVEFGDYQCPNCNKWFHETKPILDENYFDTGIANLIYIDFAFLGKDSLISAPASYCAEEQGAYWQYHDLLYPSQTGIDDGWTNSERLKAFAFSLGLDS
jgi:protein-disulfide isomerase